ncbi:MAG: ORF6N domain-containing protein [Planctomycetes bacterium]|nr:ORF6N domain-containing protein [Planctomycetota bacterium]
MAKRGKQKSTQSGDRNLIAPQTIERAILWLREKHVVIDADLAEFYGVTTKRLNQAVKRNPNKFPSDFMFRLTGEERQEVVTNCDHLERLKFSPKPPIAFTEHGVLMAASVLNTPRAADISVFVVRAFIRLREVALRHRELSRKLAELEQKVGKHDESIRRIVTAIQELMKPPKTPTKRGRIGFGRDIEK